MELKIHAISDTHNKHNYFNLPGGDILIHSGDATMGGSLKEVIKFLNWFSEQNYTHKVFVPGNHDWLFEENPSFCKSECDNRGIILLNDSGTTIEGVKFWGSPVQPEFNSWAFNRNQLTIQPHWDLIPNDTEILITHGPAWERLDYIPLENKSLGCPHLFNKILETKIRVHFCGHIHESRGFTYKDDRLWVNASALNGRYEPIDDMPRKVLRTSAGEYRVLDYFDQVIN